MNTPIDLLNQPVDAVPNSLRAETYFDFHTHPFAHQKLFDTTSSVCHAIQSLRRYSSSWLQHHFSQNSPHPRRSDSDASNHWVAICAIGARLEPTRIISDRAATPGHLEVGENSQVYGELDLDGGDIVIGAGVRVEAGAVIKGPTIIGDNVEIRSGAYLRGSIIIGNRCVIRGELKNVVIMDESTFPHPCYVGDSACGFRSHFGNQVTAANFGIFAGMQPSGQQATIVVDVDGQRYDIGSVKMGACIGDYCQVGCSSVTDPATFLRPRTVVYPLSRISRGFYGPDEVLKNKPLENGIIERAALH